VRRGLEPVSLGAAVRQRASEVSLVRFGLLSRWAQEVGGRRRIPERVIPEPRRDVVSQSFHGEKRRAIRGRNRQREMREPPPEADDERRCRVSP
jgi:hypothetical protein